jgi:type IV secretion system protein VirD4
LLPQEFKELGVDREVLILENCKPILADKIRYYTDPVFMERLMPPPDLPELDLATHRARVEHRVRPAGDDEEFGLDQIAVDFHGLPHLSADASPEQVQSFVTGFFEALEVASAQTIVPVEQTPNLQSNLEPARAA